MTITKHHFLLLLLLLLLSILSCVSHGLQYYQPHQVSSFERCYESDYEPNNDSNSNNNDGNHLSDATVDYSRSLITGLHKFSIDILKSMHNFESKESSSGLILSPFSIWSALIVSYMGALNTTERELRNVLGLGGVPKASVGMAYQGLRFWYQVKKNISLHTKDYNKKQAYSIANRIFIDSSLPLSDCIKRHFSLETQSIDFFSAPNKARKSINMWIERETGGKIRDLIPPGGINSWTTMIIANAIYFHNKWFHQFDPVKNEIAPFHVSPTESLPVAYMKLRANLMYGVSETLKASILELPYANQDFSMLIILPDASKGVDSLISILTPDSLEEVITNLYDDEVSVVLPKFKSEQEMDLAGSLYSMGVRALFDPRYSDLSGFLNKTALASLNAQQSLATNTSTTSSLKRITVNSVVHKAYVSVNEKGTEAAAATAILLARSGRPAFPTRFVANRPFLYFIRDMATNIILFVGVVRRPSQ